MRATTTILLVILATATAKNVTAAPLYHCVKDATGKDTCEECVISDKGCEARTSCEKTCKPAPPADYTYICDATAAKCIKTSKTTGDTEAECKKICKPFKPPSLGPIQFYEVIYDTIPHESSKRTHYNGTYWCDLSANSFREDLRKGDNWKVLEERDIQHGNKKWYYNAEINQCHEVSNPGTAGCFIEQYPAATCYTTSKETTYRCDFNEKDAPAPYSYNVYYEKSSPHYPTEVYRSDLLKTVSHGRFLIYKFHQPKTMSPNIFAQPCKPKDAVESE